MTFEEAAAEFERDNEWETDKYWFYKMWWDYGTSVMVDGGDVVGQEFDTFEEAYRYYYE